mgnify:CR=1 FL=1
MRTACARVRELLGTMGALYAFVVVAALGAAFAAVSMLLAAGRLNSPEVPLAADRWLAAHRPSWRAAQRGPIESTPVLECFELRGIRGGSVVCVGWDPAGAAAVECTATPFAVTCEPAAVARGSHSRSP